MTIENYVQKIKERERENVVFHQFTFKILNKLLFGESVAQSSSDATFHLLTHTHTPWKSNEQWSVRTDTDTVKLYK